MGFQYLDIFNLNLVQEHAHWDDSQYSKELLKYTVDVMKDIYQTLNGHGKTNPEMSPKDAAIEVWKKAYDKVIGGN